MDVQVFGIQKSSETRKALRFFKERRVKVHFVDLKVRAASKGELTRFVQKFGTEAVLDRESKRFKALGLGSAYYSDKKWLELLAEEPLLLKIVKNSDQFGFTCPPTRHFHQPIQVEQDETLEHFFNHLL